MSTYKEVTSLSQWEDILQQSIEQPVLLFKHSTRCPVSTRAYKEFTSFESPIDTYLVKVIQNREISNEIANKLGIKHESPQAFLITNGKAVWNTSHRKITGESLANAVESI